MWLNQKATQFQRIGNSLSIFHKILEDPIATDELETKQQQTTELQKVFIKSQANFSKTD